LKLGLFHFQLLYQVLERIHYIYEEEALANSVLQSISSALNAEGGTVFRRNGDGTLFPLASYGVPIEKLRDLRFDSKKGVVGWVIRHEQPVKVDDPQSDNRFGGFIDVRTGFKTRSILAAPILAKGKIIGVIEFLNRKDGPFAIPDLELVSMVGREVGIAFENATLVHELTKTRAFLNSLTDSFSAGIIAIDKKGKILRINPSALKILQVPGTHENWTGKPARMLFERYPGFMSAAKAVIASTEPLQRQSVNLTIKRQQRTIGYSGVPVKDPKGNRIASAILFQDITSYVKK